MNLSFQIGGTVHNLTCTPEEFEKVLPMLGGGSTPAWALVARNALKVTNPTIADWTTPRHDDCVAAFLNSLASATCAEEGTVLVRRGGVLNMTSANMPNIIRTIKLEAKEAGIPIGEICRVSGRTRPYDYHAGPKLAEFIAWRNARPATREP